MSKGMTRIRLQELFTLEENNKGTRGHSLKLAKLRCTRDYWKHFFSNRVINRWNGLDQQTVGATSLNVLKTRLETIKNTRMGLKMLTVGGSRVSKFVACAKFGRNRSIFYFSKTAAVRHLGFVVWVFGPPAKGAWWSLSLCKIWFESMQ